MRRILIIEGVLNSCHSIQTRLANDCIDISCVSSVIDAMNFLTNQNYCLVILENTLPRISVIEMLKIIRHISHIPILLLTDSLSPSDKVSLFQAGANAIMEKLINMSVCIAQAEALMQLYSKATAEYRSRGIIEVGTDLTIIPKFRQVLMNGEPLQLTRKEYDLLLYFARHPYQVFSRGQLYSRIWCNSFVSEGDETVRVHIHTLRKKLGVSGKKYICNVWGVGYKFVPENHT